MSKNRENLNDKINKNLWICIKFYCLRRDNTPSSQPQKKIVKNNHNGNISSFKTNRDIINNILDHNAIKLKIINNF